MTLSALRGSVMSGMMSFAFLPVATPAWTLLSVQPS